MEKHVMSREATIASKLIKHHFNALKQLEARIDKTVGRERVLLQKSIEYHLLKLQGLWYGKQYDCPIVK